MIPFQPKCPACGSEDFSVVSPPTAKISTINRQLEAEEAKMSDGMAGALSFGATIVAMLSVFFVGWIGLLALIPVFTINRRDDKKITALAMKKRDLERQDVESRDAWECNRCGHTWKMERPAA